MTDVPIEMKVLMNHIYEYQKGVRQMVLYTFNRRYAAYAIKRLEHRGINYVMHPAGADTVNLFLVARSAWMPFGWLLINR